MSAHRVVIVGGGFGGLYAALKLRNIGVDLTVVDRSNHHLFQPLLYQVATGGLSPAEIASPLRAILGKHPRARVLQAEVLAVDPTARRIVLDDGELPYDTLLLAAGVRHHYFGHQAWEQLAPGIKTIEDATRMRSNILGAFERAERTTSQEERRALLTFVVVGAGPTGVELAGAIGELARQTLQRNFRSIDPSRARILLVEGVDRVLPGYPERLSDAAHRSLESLGVEVLTETRVSTIDTDGVELAAGGQSRRVPARTVLWAAGVQASPLGEGLARATGVTLDSAGRVHVAADCTLPGHPEIFVIGDMARFEQDGQVLPGVAPVAMQQGRYVAESIGARLANRSGKPFRYRNRGSLAVIGRAAAVADLGPRLRFSGYPAWLLWLFVHIMMLVEFENRVLVFVQWAFSYVTRKRGARLITR